MEDSDEGASIADLVEFLTRGTNHKINNDLLRTPLIQLIRQIKVDDLTAEEKQQRAAMIEFIKTTDENLAEVFTKVIQPAFNKNSVAIKVTVGGYTL